MTAEITLTEYYALRKRPSKYSNERLTEDGYTFDSRAELRRYKELLQLEAAGQIEEFTVHPRYTLQPAFRDRQGRKHQAICFVADFSYIEIIDPQSVMGRYVVEDIKGGKATQTQVFKVKAKLFRYRYPDLDLRILEV